MNEWAAEYKPKQSKKKTVNIEFYKNPFLYLLIQTSHRQQIVPFSLNNDWYLPFSLVITIWLSN